MISKMAAESERSIEDILLKSIPPKSAELHQKTWKIFKKCSGLDDATNPIEEDYLRYFDFLRHEKKLKGSSLWTIYSRLNSVHLRLTGLLNENYD